MKSFLRGATALAGIALAGSAFAADLPRRQAPPPVFVPVPVFTWTGFYAGFNAGYGFDASSRDTNVYNNVFPNLVRGPNGLVGAGGPSQVAYSNNSNEGFTGGGQIGYNYQFTPGSGVVVGIEADAQYVDFGRSRNNSILTPGFTAVPGVTFVDPRGTASLDYFGTVRGRLGYAFDRTLVYGTGGFAYGAGSNERSFGLVRGPNGLVGAGGPSQVAYSNNSNEGFTGGGQIGYNYQFTPGSGVVVGIEADAQYVDFGRSRNNSILTPGFTAVPGVTFVDPRGTASLDYFGTVRGRLGYAFDRTLVYGTGGFAYGAGSNERSFGGFRGNDDFRTGWAAGGGIEYALPTDSFLNFFRSSAVTLKVEGLYVNLDPVREPR
ncbi:hypothetical protein ASF57_00005, partial [Methylobacterium sp. Leaf117]